MEISEFNPLALRNLARLNNRTHRKLLVVDGRVGFIGGVGIADEWAGHAQDPDHWRDNHFQVEGPVVAQLQSAFVDHAVALGQSVSSGDAYFPPLSPAGEVRAHVFKSAPRGGNASLRLMYLMR